MRCRIWRNFPRKIVGPANNVQVPVKITIWAKKQKLSQNTSSLQSSSTGKAHMVVANEISKQMFLFMDILNAVKPMI